MNKLIKEKREITEADIGKPVIYINAGHQEIGLIANIPNMKGMVEVSFRTDENPLMLNKSVVDLIKIN